MKNKISRKWILAGLLIIIGSLFSFDKGERLFEITRNLELFATLYKELNMYYVDDLNPNKTIKTGIDAMLKQLDPYTNYFAEDDIEDYMTMTTGKYNGIGAVVSSQKGKHTVLLVYENTPAEKAGLLIGDEIQKIDGIDVRNSDKFDIGKLLKGQTGTFVKLVVQHYGLPNTQELMVQRDIVKLNNVTYYGMINDEVGYIDLKDFTATAAKEVRTSYTELKAKGMKKLIIDVRDNPGGLLNMAVDICNLFLPKDSEVVSTKGKISEWNKVYTAANPPIDTEMPIAVLTNSHSASAAEIVSGTIQDYDRGVLIGQRTFGKGLVQITRDLVYNARLKITTAKYYIPSGRCIQAIDYSHRNADGSVGKFPDSLRTAFKTKNGRVVYDGGGVAPDIDIEKPSLSSIANTLSNKNLIFEFANKYKSEHPTIKPAKEFLLTDVEYQAFITWVTSKDYDYTTEVERELKQLEASAKKEKYYTSIEDQLKALSHKIAHSKDADLQTFKTEIKTLLEQEIVLRYYLQKGNREYSFAQDPEIQTTLNLFKDMPRYQAILSGKK